MDMRGFGISAIITGTSRRQLEALNSEGQVMIIRIVDQKSVVDGFLQALGFIALRNKRASVSSCGTFFNTSGLGQSFIVGLNMVDHNSPFTGDIDGSQRLDVSSLRGAQICFLNDFFQPIDRVVSVGQNILVHLLHRIVVIFDSLLDFIGGVFGVFEAPGFWVVN
jgi:hypothetical protein